MVGVSSVSTSQRVEQRGAPEPSQQNQRVAQTAQPIIHSVKESVVWCWKAVYGFVSGTVMQVNFVFFRILNWIHPSIGPQVEIAFLRIKERVDAMRHGWKQVENRQKIDALLRRNHSLEVKVKGEAKWVENYRPLYHEYALLVKERESFEKGHLSLAQQNKSLEQQREIIAVQVGVEKQTADQALAGQEALQLEKVGLLEEKKRLEVDLAAAQKLAQELKSRLELQQGLAPLAATHESLKAKVLAQLNVNGCGKEASLTPLQQKAVLRALPLLLSQLQNGQKYLGELEKQLPEETALKNLKRILDDMGQLWTLVPAGVKVSHSMPNFLSVEA